MFSCVKVMTIYEFKIYAYILHFALQKIENYRKERNRHKTKKCETKNNDFRAVVRVVLNKICLV